MPTRFAWDISDDSQPGVDIVPITPSDSADISTTIGNDTIVGVRALRAQVAGNIKVTMAGGNDRTLAFLAGETRPGFFKRVWGADTTATGISGYV